MQTVAGYSTRELEALRDTYRDGLLEDTLPFWMRYAVDREMGGFFTCLNRDGVLLDTDKSVWAQGRFTWLLSTLYSSVEARPEWLSLASHGIDFIRKHCFDDDGRLFFQVARDGQPLRKRRYAFSEAFAAMAFAAYAKAAKDEQAAEEARRLAGNFVHYTRTPGLLEPKGVPSVRPAKSIGAPMILINIAQTLRETLDAPECQTWIDESIEEIRGDFVKPELEAVMETVGPKGEFIDHFDGRILNPGHAIEAAWFILREAEVRGNGELLRLGTSMLDWMWDFGWDSECGGLFYFRDIRGLPVQEYWHDMKFWWPHNEAIIATLMAWRLTGDPAYAARHRAVHDWAYAHFPDKECGEWYGYLHRDGRISVPMKGNLWKGPFHLPRMQWLCWGMCEEALRAFLDSE